MFKYVVRYQKRGDAIYISHLDFLRALQRAMRRAALPLKFSEGFNPHPCLSFAQPLGVGITGENELFEVELCAPCPDLVERLNASMPRGISVSEATLCERNDFAAIARAVYEVQPRVLPAAAQVETFLALPEIRMEKRTKSGMKEADIRPDIFEAKLSKGGLFLRLSAGNSANLKPSLVMAAMETYMPGYAPGFCRYTRLYLTDAGDRQL